MRLLILWFCLVLNHLHSSISPPHFPRQIWVPFGSILEENFKFANASFYMVDHSAYANRYRNDVEMVHRPYYLREPKSVYQHIIAMCKSVQNQAVLLMGTPSRSSLSSVMYYSNVLNIPYLTSSPPLFHYPYDMKHSTLFLRPPILPSLHALLDFFGWKSIFYIFNHDDGLRRVEWLEKTFGHRNVLMFPLRLYNINNCYKPLRQLDQMFINQTNKHIVLDIDRYDHLKILLDKLMKVGMNRPNYKYLVCSLAIDEMKWSKFTMGGANVVGFNLDIKLFNAKIPKLEVALMKDAVDLSKNVFTYLLKHKSNSLQTILTPPSLPKFCHGNGSVVQSLTSKSHHTPKNFLFDELRQVSLQGLTGHIQFDKNGMRVNYTLEVKSFNEKTRETIGRWSNGVLDMVDKSHAKTNVSNNSAAITRVVVSIIQAPYMMKRILKKRERDAGVVLHGNERYEGYCADLAKTIASKLNFKYAIKIVDDGKYGEKQKNGSWNGMVGVLSRKEADMAIAPMTISSVRERVLDFSKPFMNLGISIMIKKPDKQKPGVFSFMEPLSYNIWMCIIFAYLSVSGVLFLVSRFSPNEWQIEDSEKGPAFVNDLTLSNSMWFSLGAFMRRGCEVCPRSLAGRVVGSAWWFFTLIIISSYTANLAAFLTIERMLVPIKNAYDLAYQSEIQYGTLDAGSTKDFFRSSKVPLYEKMWNYMNNRPHVFAGKVVDGIQKVKNSKGKYAFLLESSMNDYANQRKPCDTMRVGDNLDSKGYGVATYIGSNLREKINVAILDLLENEYLQKLHKKWWYDKGECIVENESKNSGSSQSLSLSNVAGIFYILISGLCLSLLAASIEFYCKFKVELKRRKKRGLDKNNDTHIYETTPEKSNGNYVYITPCAMTTVIKTNSLLDNKNNNDSTELHDNNSEQNLLSEQDEEMDNNNTNNIEHSHKNNSSTQNSSNNSNSDKHNSKYNNTHV